MRGAGSAGTLTALALLVGAGPAVATSAAGDGARIYRDGLLPSGAPVSATTLGEIRVAGAQASCASCHRRSGYGSTEGGLYAPPVTGPSLFGPRRLDRAELFSRLFQDVLPKRLYSEARDPRVRPAYTAASLELALREGLDPSGRRLDPIMPRYALPAPEMASLVSYLELLGARDAPGVGSETIHFATIFAPAVDPRRRRAVEAVLDAFVERKNQDTRDLLARPGSSPLHHDDFRDSYRLWQVHRWQLDGAPGTWRAQLDAHYRRRPVFAVLGGLGTDEWGPVHRFCEQTELPCLFPNVELPGPDAGAYTLYLSRGLPGEAAALAAYLRAGPEALPAGRVTQVFRRGPRGEALAGALRAGLEGAAVELAELAIGPRAPAGPEIAAAVTSRRPEVLVLWLERPDLDGLDLGSEPYAGIGRIVLAHGLLGELPEIDGPARDRIRLTYPRALPGHEPARLYRLRAWLRSRGLPADEEAAQLHTHFALTVTDHALHHIVGRFSRDFFVESVEHETENELNPGVFPRLSLGPGQRYASKGSYVVRFVEGEARAIEPVGGWIVPENR